MRGRGIALAFTALAAIAGAALLRRRTADDAFVQDFALDPADLVSEGRSPFFVLEPGWVLELEGPDSRLLVTVLDETERVDGVETRVVEEREWEGGELVEVSRNFFAMSSRTLDLYYFAEDVDIWEDGRVTGHEGAWRAGVGGAGAGLMVPGAPAPGLRHHQEVAEGVAMDRAEVLSVTETVTVPAGRFTGVLRVEETTPLEPLAREEKVYAPGVGLLRDGEAELVRYGTPAGPACLAPDADAALDHVILAVTDLEAAAAAYGALGFTLKQGRLHPNGLLNRHVKLADGSELELMGLRGEPGDAMARGYASVLEAGGGGAYVAIRASPDAVLAAARTARITVEESSVGAARYVTLSDPGGEAVFFLQPPPAASDPDSLLTHANGAAGLVQAWVEAGGELSRLLLALGATECGQVILPDGREARVLGLANGSLVLATPGAGRARLLGASLAGGSPEGSRWLPPSRTLGLWLGLPRRR